MPSCAARDAGFSRTSADRSARLADAACCLALQQARANRGGPCQARFAPERNNRMEMIRHQQAHAATPYESLVIKFTAPRTALPVSARHSWFLPRGAQLIVIKNQLPTGTRCGIV